MKYSIWILPPEPVFGELQKIIKDLSHKYKSPVFKPHVTILGSVNKDLDVIKNAVKKTTSRIMPLKLFLGPISFSTTYFQSVFVRVNSTALLLQLNVDLKKLLSIENTYYMPHISLIYGNHDMQTREEIAVQVKIRNFSFTSSEIVIIPEYSEPYRWKPMESFPFGLNRRV